MYTGIYRGFEQMGAEVLYDRCTGFGTEISTAFAQSVHSLINRSIHSLPKQRPVIPKDHPRRVMPRCAGDAAAGMGAGAAMIEAL
jgi:hypothetical protein